MNEFLQAFVSLLAITNPIVAAPLFLGIVAGLPLDGKRRAARGPAASCTARRRWR